MATHDTSRYFGGTGWSVFSEAPDVRKLLGVGIHLASPGQAHPLQASGPSRRPSNPAKKKTTLWAPADIPRISVRKRRDVTPTQDQLTIVKEFCRGTKLLA